MIDGSAITHGPWTGGVIYNLPPESLEENECTDTINVRIGQAGQAEKRQGSVIYGTSTSLSGDPNLMACGQYRQSATASPIFIAAADKFYEYSSGNWVDRTGGLTITADKPFEWTAANGTLVLTNGTNPPVKWYTPDNANLTLLDLDSRFTTALHTVFWDNRLWMANTNANVDRLWYSNLADIETWGATSFYNLGSEILGLAAVSDTLAIHTADGIHTLTATGNATIPYQLKQQTQQAGLSGRCILTVPGNRQFFIQEEGIYEWDGDKTVTKVSAALDDGYWEHLNAAKFVNTFAVYYRLNNELWFWLPYGATQANMNHIMVYNLEEERWHGPFQGNAPGTYYERSCAALIDKKPHAGNFVGQLIDHDPTDVYTDLNDAATAAIHAQFTTSAKAPEGEETRLKWLFSRSYFDGVGDYDVVLTQTSSGLSGTSETVNMGKAGFALDSDKLDLTALGSIRVRAYDAELSGYDPHSSVTVAQNVSGEHFRYRKVVQVYKDLGIKRKRVAGVS
jgi:hypothetical protein